MTTSPLDALADRQGPLSRRSFRWLLAGGTVSAFGGALTSVAGAPAVLERHSPA